MDDASPANIQKLKTIAQKLIAENDQAITALAAELTV